MNPSSVRLWVGFAIVVLVAAAGCEFNSAGLDNGGAADGSAGLDGSRPFGGTSLAYSADAGRVSPAPALKPGVDPAMFLPLVAGYNPSAEELATSGKGCASDADCATSSGQIVFRCSTPYYGHAQCQGTFPPGEKVTPGVVPSCAYYDCPAGYECATDATSLSVTCLPVQASAGKLKRASNALACSRLSANGRTVCAIPRVRRLMLRS